MKHPRYDTSRPATPQQVVERHLANARAEIEQRWPDDSAETHGEMLEVAALEALQALAAPEGQRSPHKAPNGSAVLDSQKAH